MLEPDLLEAAARLGWVIRPTGNERETCLGDYARGYLLLERENYIQLARRSERGEPTLKLWSPDAALPQKYLAFATARLVRYYERPDASVALPTDPAALAPGFFIEHDESGNVFLKEDGAGGLWAGFGAGNEYLAVQVSHLAVRSVAEVVRDMLAPDAESRFPGSSLVTAHR